MVLISRHAHGMFWQPSQKRAMQVGCMYLKVAAALQRGAGSGG